MRFLLEKSRTVTAAYQIPRLMKIISISRQHPIFNCLLKTIAVFFVKNAKTDVNNANAKRDSTNNFAQIN